MHDVVDLLCLQWFSRWSELNRRLAGCEDAGDLGGPGSVQLSVDADLIKAISRSECGRCTAVDILGCVEARELISAIKRARAAVIRLEVAAVSASLCPSTRTIRSVLTLV